MLLRDNKVETLWSALAKTVDVDASDLNKEGEIREIAEILAKKPSLYFLARGTQHRAACKKGALKLKEISYNHAEAYAAEKVNTARSP